MLEYSMKVNLKTGAKFALGFLIIVVTGYLQKYGYSVAAWTIRILTCIFVGVKWYRYIKKKSKVKFFTVSFWCVGIVWAWTAYLIFSKHKLGTEFIFLIAAVWIAGLVTAFRAGSNSWKMIKKYYPDAVKEYESVNNFFEVFNNAAELESKLSALKEDAPAALAEAVMRWETMKTVPIFHLEMIFLEILVLGGTPYI